MVLPLRVRLQAGHLINKTFYFGFWGRDNLPSRIQSSEPVLVGCLCCFVFVVESVIDWLYGVANCQSYFEKPLILFRKAPVTTRQGNSIRYGKSHKHTQGIPQCRGNFIRYAKSHNTLREFTMHREFCQVCNRNKLICAFIYLFLLKTWMRR